MKKYILIISILCLYCKIQGHSQTIDDKIHYYSNKHKIDKALVLAIIKVESNFNPKAISRNFTGHGYSVGLMQINTNNYPNLKIKQLYDIDLNLDLGCGLLKQCLIWSCGYDEVALLFYNFGRKNVIIRHKKIPQITLDYIEKVLMYRKYYELIIKYKVLI